MNAEKNQLLNFSNGGKETPQTSLTPLFVTNDVFINGIFGDINGPEKPVIVGFKGDPGKVSKSAWFGKPYTLGKTVFNPEENNYTSFASYTPDKEGQYRRRKEHFAALHAIMLDDVGQKVDLDRVTLQPSWIIETSLGNFQYGYALSEPLRNSSDADILLNAIIEAGLCDPRCEWSVLKDRTPASWC